MPNPTSRDLQVVDPLLTNISVAYAQEADMYVADWAFPMVPTDVQGGKYPIYDKGSWLRSEARVRAPGTETAGGGWTVSSASFFCDIYGVHKDLDDPTKAVGRSRAGAGFDLERDATQYVTDQLLLKRDKLWVARFFANGVWNTQVVGVAAAPGVGQALRWDVAGSTPITDLKTQIILGAQATGKRFNRFVIGPYVWLALSEHATILDRIKYSERAIVTEDLIAALVGPQGSNLQVRVAWAIENTAAEGAADNFQFLAGKHALLTYAPPRPGLLTPSGGYTFAWTGYPGTGPNGTRIKNFRIEQIASDRIEGEMAQDPRIVGQDLGVFFYTIAT